MQSTSRDDAHKRALQQRQQRDLQSAPREFPQMNGGDTSHSNVASRHRRATYAGPRRRTPAEPPPFYQNHSDRNLGVNNNSLLGDADEDYENFQRSFARRSNPLDSFAGPSLEEPSSLALTSVSASAAPYSSGSTSRHSQQQQQQQQQIQHLLLQQQQSSPSSTPQQRSQSNSSHEDPTIVQARNSMMARTKVRHGRGKLPEPKEGKCMPPRSSTVEPVMPPPRGSRRFAAPMQRRVPDLAEGVGKLLGSYPVVDDEHIVTCEECRLGLVVKRSAILVRCEACNTVNAASSSTTIFRSTSG